jgi:chemotaxis protein methyltransferase CheR
MPSTPHHDPGQATPYRATPYRTGPDPLGPLAANGGGDGLRFYTESLGLPESAFALLRDLIHERTGLFYDDSKRDLLADKLSARVVDRGFSSFLDYYYLLKYDETEAAEEWRRVMDALSVPETYFWRELDQVRALVERVVPEHFARAPLTPFRVWSAACCSGEEPLSIAMALNEAGWFGRAPIEITATDASPAAIDRARRGLYRDRSFRALPPELRAKYFTGEAGGWRVDAGLQARITYDTQNLLQPEVARRAAVHAIFCRNVFIYFSADAIRKTVQRFHAQMPSPGYLFLGASESLLKLTTDFELQEAGGAFVYVKK